MKRPPNIVAGENIPYVKEAFEGLGNLTMLPGRSITSADLKDTQILLIRSITQVDETLLQGTPIEFIGSASAGTDHMDTAYLQSHNIEFTSASGSNANSVAEYVIAAVLLLGKERDISLEGKTIGIVGVGEIGSNPTKGLNVAQTFTDSFLLIEEFTNCSLPFFDQKNGLKTGGPNITI